MLFINADAEFHAGRAQNYLRPEHVEKIVSTFERFEDVRGYARGVPLTEIKGEANDYNLNIRRYVDNSPPPELHDVRAHLMGGVPRAEVTSQRPLLDALGFDPASVFMASANGPMYFDFNRSIVERDALRPIVDNDLGVRAHLDSLREALLTWWNRHSQRLADLPRGRNLNAVRTEFLETFVEALLPHGLLDRFKLAGVVASWWTDTLPDFKTLLENGFAGVIDGWVDAIADALGDDELAGPTFDPFAHKLVVQVMPDYLNRIAEAHTDIARLKGEKEAFEQSNPPEDADVEELENWNYAKDLERQIRQIKIEHRDELKELGKLERLASKVRATDGNRNAAIEARARMQAVLDDLAYLDVALRPYQQIKQDLSEARGRYRDLTNMFANELRNRCTRFDPDQARSLVLQLFARDLQLSLGAAVAETRHELIQFIEKLWDKYAISVRLLTEMRDSVALRFSIVLEELGYGR